MWLSDHNMDGLAKFFVEKKRFDWLLVISFIIFSVIHIILAITLFNWLFIESPCAGKEVCSL